MVAEACSDTLVFVQHPQNSLVVYAVTMMRNESKMF